jgi:transcriptional regulator with XRE-family HTH domain
MNAKYKFSIIFFSEKLRKVLKDRKLSYREAGKLLRLEYVTVFRIAKGIHTPEVQTLANLFKLLPELGSFENYILPAKEHEPEAII